jgi:hypothetical protein
MTRTKILLLAVLLAPAAAFAETVAVDWSGQIYAYAASPGSVYAPTLSDTSVSGVFTFDTNLLPLPDAGNPAGVLSFTGSGFMQSSVQWSGGPFAADPSGSTGSNNLFIDTNADQVIIQDSSSYMDGLGTPHQALLSLTVNGLLAATSSGGTLGTLGYGDFYDLTAPADGSAPGGVEAFFTTDSVTVQAVAVPEPDTASLSVGMLLAVMMVALIRRRRKEA